MVESGLEPDIATCRVHPDLKPGGRGFLEEVRVTHPTTRATSKSELDEVIQYWRDCPRCSEFLVESSLISFLRTFTPHQIKGAMYLATSTGRMAYFRYMCGILHKWKRSLEHGEEPQYFDVGAD